MTLKSSTRLKRIEIVVPINIKMIFNLLKKLYYWKIENLNLIKLKKLFIEKKRKYL